LSGIFWILRTGARWRDLPECYGAWQSVYGRFNRWSRDGTIDKVLESLHGMLDAKGKIDRELWCVDGSSVRAQRAAAGAGKKGARTSLRTTLLVALAAWSFGALGGVANR
jgi:transposase